MKHIKIFFYLTATDCFRPPAVMQRAHQAPQAGQCAGLISQDQAKFIRVDDEWLSAVCQVEGDCEALADLQPDLAILDDLDFPDIAGQPTGQWRVNCGGRQLSLCRLAQLFDRLRASWTARTVEQPRILQLDNHRGVEGLLAILLENYRLRGVRAPGEPGVINFYKI